MENYRVTIVLLFIPPSSYPFPNPLIRVDQRSPEVETSSRSAGGFKVYPQDAFGNTNHGPKNIWQ